MFTANSLLRVIVSIHDTFVVYAVLQSKEVTNLVDESITGLSEASIWITYFFALLIVFPESLQGEDTGARFRVRKPSRVPVVLQEDLVISTVQVFIVLHRHDTEGIRNFVLTHCLINFTRILLEVAIVLTGRYCMCAHEILRYGRLDYSIALASLLVEL